MNWQDTAAICATIALVGAWIRYAIRSEIVAAITAEREVIHREYLPRELFAAELKAIRAHIGFSDLE